MKIGDQTYLYPNGFNPFTNEKAMVGSLIATIMELPCDVIAIFHEREEEQPDSKPENKKLTGKKTVTPPRAEHFLPLFNEHWRMDHNGDKYICYPRANHVFNGATCLGIDAEETPDITKLIEKHEERKTRNGENTI
jgi:hypothetical protein